jgi:hypothetical protein
MSPKRSRSPRESRRAQRAHLRAQGLKPIEIWVPDVDSPQFAAEAERQSRLIAESPEDAEDQAFVDAISEPLDDD